MTFSWTGRPALLGGLVLLASTFLLLKLAMLSVVARHIGGLASMLCRFDCGWYTGIATQGYWAEPSLESGRNPQANWAFFPAYPMLMRLVGWITGRAPAVSGLIVSTLCTIAFAVIGAVYRMRTRTKSDPWLFVCLIVAWPFGFYFTAPYSEALYALMLTLGLLAVCSDRLLLGACAAAVLTATRPTGMLLAAVLGVAAFVGAARQWRGAARGEERLRIVADTLLVVAIAPLGLVGYMLWLHWTVGDALAFAHIQIGWGRETRNPLAVLAEAIAVDDWDWDIWFRFHLLDGGAISYRLVWVGLATLATAWLALRRRYAEAFLCLAPVLVALSSGGTMSIVRFITTNPVFLIAAADLLDPLPRAVSTPLLCLLFGAQMLLVVAWSQNAYFLV